MREIKFRGLSKHGWVYGDLVHKAFDGYNTYDTGIKEYGCYPKKVEPETVGEFTGLKDVNGIDVYEHDIVRFTTHDAIGFVKFENLCFMVETIDGNHYLQGYEIEIIGNIHENPELLKNE